MIIKVTKEDAKYMEPPMKFETGTGRLEAVYGLGAAIEYLQKIGWSEIEKSEREITEYLLSELTKFECIEFYGPKDPEKRLAILSFNIKGVHSHDVAQILDRFGICVRSGHHCAQILMDSLEEQATVRASFYIYNSKKDVDALIAGIKEVKKVFKI